MSDLKPCPFCGEAESVVAVWMGNGGDAEATCRSCDASVPFLPTIEMAVERWNNRPIEDAMRNDLMDALDLKAGRGPTALSMVVAERDALRREVEELREATRRVAQELRGSVGAFEWSMREALGNTNYNCLVEKLSVLESLLARGEEGALLRDEHGNEVEESP